ncbi:hypothetical protein [uncultured Roseobacter sp.]|uniref:hypothetical protein n=1 Tax=uncultured Roseobacter sp. TaxID=114847 RepID=UPI00260AB7E6|nr:hypothetical protein [uncultured Roseobacter sp.]
MIKAEVSKQLAALRTHIFEHAAAQTALPRPRKTRLAVEALEDSVRRLENPALFDDWEETYVLLCCHRRLKPARTHGRLKRMEERYVSKGQKDRFVAFFERVKQTLHPDFVTPHGYNKTFGEMAADDIFSRLDDAMAPVLELGKPVILYAGALLGYVREGRLIDHDDDIDFAVHLGETTLEEIPEKWALYQRSLLEGGCLDTGSSTRGSPIFKVENSLGIDIDLFPAWAENGHYSVYPYSLNALPENAIFPLKSLNNGRIMLPHDAPALLAQSYGENWRVPDPLFHFDWPTARRKFAPLLQRDFSVK